MQYTYHDNLNLHTVHRTLVDRLQEEVTNVKHLEMEMNIMKQIVRRSSNPSDAREAKARLDEISNKVFLIKQGKYIDSFNRYVSRYLNEYTKLNSNTYMFGVDKCVSIPKRVYMINMYLTAASEYIHIQHRCTYDMSKICTQCFDIMKKLGTTMRCNNCGYTYAIIAMPCVYMDEGILCKPSTYVSSKNFRKEYSHICGLIHKVPDEEISDVDMYLYKVSVYDPTRDDIRMAIPACGYSNYNDTNYIFTRITGSPLPPLDKYIDICTDRFSKYYNVFETIDTEGDNITNIHFLVKLFLWQECIIYDTSWFRSLSANTESKHRRNAKKICKILESQDHSTNWKYPPEWDILSDETSRRQ